MNQDFHYNATYLAASIAGFSAEDSLVIATAAQFVDDCVSEVMPKNPFVNQVPTCEKSSNLALQILDSKAYTKQDILNRRRIWSYFHFLPGNFDEHIVYQGDMEKVSITHEKWTYENAGSDGFKMMCVPNSELAKMMMEDIIQQSLGSQRSLEFIGLRMHILADTWAHSYFSGTPDQCVNDLNHSDGFMEIINNSKRGIDYIQTGLDIIDDKPESSFYGVVQVDSPRFISPVYVGHGRVGHLPDYAYCTYQYQPMWKTRANGEDRYHIKNNPEYFMNAFKQMVHVMKAIKMGQSKDSIDASQLLTPELEQDILMVITKRKIEISSEWNALILKYYNVNLPTYKSDTWIKEFNIQMKDNNSLAENSHYVRFTKAAKIHYDWVERYVDGKLEIIPKPFTTYREGNDLVMRSGLLCVMSPFLIIDNNQEKSYQSNIIPGIENIQLLPSQQYNTSNPLEIKSKSEYEYVLLVRGGCPKNLSSVIFEFKDRSGDLYTLSVIDSTVKTHTVFYNSPNPEIVKIVAKLQDSVFDTLSYGGGQVVETVSDTAKKVGKEVENLFKKTGLF